MNLRYLPALWFLLGCLTATAAEPVQTTPPPPDKTVVTAPSPGTTPKSVEPTPGADKPGARSATSTEKSTAPGKDGAADKAVAADKPAEANGDFKPSEEISEDMAVAYPVDI